MEQMVTVPRFKPGNLRHESLQHYQNSQLAPSYAYYKQNQVLFYVMQKNIYIYIYVYQKSKNMEWLYLCIGNLQCDVRVTARQLIIDITYSICGTVWLLSNFEL